MVEQKDPRKRRTPHHTAAAAEPGPEHGRTSHAGVKDAGAASRNEGLAVPTTLDPIASNLIGINLCLRSMNSLLRHLASPNSPAFVARDETIVEQRLPLTPHVRKELFAIVHFISERSDQLARELLDMQHKRKN